jgi:hypothetical protein
MTVYGKIHFIRKLFLRLISAYISYIVTTIKVSRDGHKAKNNRYFYMLQETGEWKPCNVVHNRVIASVKL